MNHQRNINYIFAIIFINEGKEAYNFEKNCELSTRVENNKDFVLNLCYQNAINQKNLFLKFLNWSRNLINILNCVVVLYTKVGVYH